MEGIVNIISTVGFPIVLCLIFIWYIKYLVDEQAKERTESQAWMEKMIDKFLDKGEPQDEQSSRD